MKQHRGYQQIDTDVRQQSERRHPPRPRRCTPLVMYDSLKDALSGDPTKIEFLREIVSSADHVVVSESS